MFNAALEDLKRSGLEPADIEARVAGMPENAALKVAGGSDGYVIPYFDMLGKHIPFFRVRYFGQAFKYKQPGNVGNYLYYPPKFAALLKKKMNNSEIINIVLCEGEKKAAAAVSNGILACAFGGVDSWRNRTIKLPKNAEITSNKSPNGKSTYSVKIMPGTSLEDAVVEGALANGFRELVDKVIAHDWHLTIIYDTDDKLIGVKPQIQRAAAILGFELVSMGVAFNHIHQYKLPILDKEKMGLDDYLVLKDRPERIRKRLRDIVTNQQGSFPRHPNVKEYISKILQSGRLNRAIIRKLSLAILADMEARGKRIRSLASGEMYFFNRRTRKLIETEFVHSQRGNLHSTPFGQWMFKTYGIAADDAGILTSLHAYFETVQPIEEITPHRILCKPQAGEDIVRYQVNDGQYIEISGDVNNPIKLCDNGSGGVLFEADQMEPLDGAEVVRQFHAQRKVMQENSNVLPCWWRSVVADTRIKKDDDLRNLISLLFYMAPWLNRWRGMQLPIEIALGEPGSGKSSMYEHRLNVMTGRATLRNAPTDIKDWHASVASSGGLHLTDNVVLKEASLRQRLSDELCRLVTEPDPHIEMRKLYSNGKLIRLPISTTFAMTAIQQPFLNADVLQRSIIMPMDKASAVDSHGKMSYDSSWVPKQMTRFGGREAWAAHQLLALHRFFQVVYVKWNPNYAASYRLINVEQGLMCMAEVFGIQAGWIPKYLSSSTRQQVSSSDLVLEGLINFARHIHATAPGTHISSGLVVTWAEAEGDFPEGIPLLNARKLGRYLVTNKQMVREVCGFVSIGKRQNKEMFRIEPRDSWKTVA